MAKYDASGVAMYLDPPYTFDSRSKYTNSYGVELQGTAQVNFLTQICSLKSMVVLSGYRSPLYDEALQGWRRVDRTALTQASNKGTARGTATESLWLNSAAARQLPTLF